jgi:hypothetical protein
MPWTFSHPAAILPLKRFCPAHLSLPALAIGAMVPDAGYYFGLYRLAEFTHLPIGALAAGVPSGLLLLFAFFAVRMPVWFLLPEPHRSALASAAASPWSLRPLQVLVYCVSIWIGAWTHIIWDSFTHEDGWSVLRIPALQEIWINVASMSFEGYSVLQHASTLVGFGALLVAYLAFLKPQPRAASAPGADRRRYLIIFGSAFAALVPALILATRDASHFNGTDARSVFVFQTAIYGTSIFAALILLAAFLHARKRAGAV